MTKKLLFIALLFGMANTEKVIAQDQQNSIIEYTRQMMENENKLNQLLIGDISNKGGRAKTQTNGPVVQSTSYTSYFDELRSWPNPDGEIEIPYYDNPYSLGDINGDGYEDFAVSRTFTGEYNGISHKTIVFAGGESAITEVAVVDRLLQPLGDLNNDGTDEMIGFEFGSSTERIEIYSFYDYGNGEGEFGYVEEITNYNRGFFNEVYDYGDFNGDGYIDLALIEGPVYDGFYESLELQLFYGTGSIYFNSSPSATYTIPVQALIKASNDVQLKILGTTGEALFGLNVIGVGNQLYSFNYLQNDAQLTFIEDLSGDIGRPAKLDLINTPLSGAYPDLLFTDGQYTSFLTHNGSTYNEVLEINTAYTLIGDVNNDGIDDFSINGTSMRLGVTDNIDSDSPDYVAMNNSEPISMPFSTEYADRFFTTPIDVNGDGIDDFVSGFSYAEEDRGGIYVALSNETLSNFSTIELDDPNHGEYDHVISQFTQVGDLNGDGMDDFAAAIAAQNKVNIYLATPNGLNDIPDFSFEEVFEYNSPLMLSYGDYNGDGINDIAVGNNSYIASSHALILSDGAGGFNMQIVELLGDEYGYRSYWSVLEDMNDDGFDELIVPAFKDNDSTMHALIWEGGEPFLSDNFQIVELTSEKQSSALAGAKPQAIGDFNNDGFNDILVNDHYSTNEAKIIFGNSDLSALQYDHRIPTVNILDEYSSAEFSITAVGDVNNDGIVDLGAVARNSSTFNHHFVIWYGGETLSENPDELLELLDSNGESPFYTNTTINRIDVGGSADPVFFLTDYFSARVVTLDFDNSIAHIADLNYTTNQEYDNYYAFWEHQVLVGKTVDINEGVQYQNVWIPRRNNLDALSSTRVYGYQIQEIDGIPLKVGEAPTRVEIAGSEIYRYSDFEGSDYPFHTEFEEELQFYNEEEYENGFNPDVYKLAFIDEAAHLVLPVIIEDNDSETIDLIFGADDYDFEDALYSIGVGDSRFEPNLISFEWDPSSEDDSYEDYWEYYRFKLDNGGDYNMETGIFFGNIPFTSGDTLFIHLQFVSDTTGIDGDCCYFVDYNPFRPESLYDDDDDIAKRGEVFGYISLLVIDDGYNQTVADDGNSIGLVRNSLPSLETPLTLSMLEDHSVTFQTAEILNDDQFKHYSNLEVLAEDDEMLVSIELSNNYRDISFTPGEDYYGQHWVKFRFTDPFGYSKMDSSLFTITPVNDPPLAKATFSEVETGVIAFNNESNDAKDPNGAIVSTTWFFGDGNSSNEFNPIHAYSKNGEYQVELIVTDNSGTSDTTNLAVMVDGLLTSIYDEQLPTEFALENNYPNPFNPATTIQFGLPEAALVRMEVFNMLGQRVATLVNNDNMQPGWHSVQFEAGRLSSGVYIYRIQAGDFVQTKRMMLIK